jgi:hypothetical protein
MEELRKFIRHPRRLEAAYGPLIDGSVGELITQTETVNISRGGCTLLTRNPERPGVHIAVHLALPSGEEVSINGLIAWTREPFGDNPGTIGVYFGDAHPLPVAFLALLDEAERAS